MADTSACRCRPCCCLSCSGRRYMVLVASARVTQWRLRQRRQRQVRVTVVTSGLQPKPLHSLLLPACGSRSRSLKCDALLPEAATASAAAAAAATTVAAAAEAFPWSIVTSSRETTANHRATYANCRSSASSGSLLWWQQQEQQQHKRIDQPTAGQRHTVSRCCRQRKPQQRPLAASAARLLLLLPALILVGAGTIASGAPPNARPIELDWAGSRSYVEAPAAWQQAARKTGRPCTAQSSEHLRAIAVDIAAEAGDRRVQAGGPSEQWHDLESSLGQTGPSSSSSSQEACESFVELSHASRNRQYDGTEQEAAAASADLTTAVQALATSRPTGEDKAAAAAAKPPTQLSIAALDEYAHRDTKHGTGDNEPASQPVHKKAAVVTPATGTADDATTQLRLLPQPTRPSTAAAVATSATPLTGTQQLLIDAQTLVRILVQPLKAAAAAASAAGHDTVSSSRSVAALPTASADAEFRQQATQSIGTRTATLAPSHYEAILFYADNIGTNAEAAADENSESVAAVSVTTAKMGKFNGDSERSVASDRRVGSSGHALATSAADPAVYPTAEAADHARGLHVPRVQAVRQLGQEPVLQLLQVAADAAAVATASVSSHTPSISSSTQTVSSWATTSPWPAAAAAEAAATLKTTAAAAATAVAAGEDIAITAAALLQGSRTTAGLQPLASAVAAAMQSTTAAESHDQQQQQQQQQQQKPSDPGVRERNGGSSITGAADSRLLTEERSSQTTMADSRATSIEPVQQQQQRTTAVSPSRSTKAFIPPTSRPPSYQGSELQPCEETGSRCAGSSGQPPGHRPNAAQSVVAFGTTDNPEPISHNDGRGNWAIGTVAGAATGGLAALVWLIGVPLAYVFCRRHHRYGQVCRSRRAGADNREARYEQHRTEHSHLEELIMLELAKARSRGYVCDSDKVNYDEVFHLNASVANQITTEL